MITSINEFRKYINENKTLIGNSYGNNIHLYDHELLALLGINEDTRVTSEMILKAYNNGYIDTLKNAGVTDMEHKDHSSNDVNKKVISTFTKHRIKRAVIYKFTKDYIHDNKLHIYNMSELLKEVEINNYIVNDIEGAERYKERIINSIIKSAQYSGNIQDIDIVSYHNSELKIIVTYTDTDDDNVYIIDVKNNTKTSGKYRSQTLESPEEYPETEYDFNINKNAIQILPDGTKHNVVLSDVLYNLLEKEIYYDIEHNDNSKFM